MLILWGSIAGYVAAFAPLVFSGVLDSYGWTSAFVFIALLSLAALIALPASTGQIETPLAPFSARAYGRLFRARPLWLVFAYVFCTYGAITYHLFQLPIRLSGNGAGHLSVGLALTILWLTFAALSALLRNKVDGAHIRTITLAAPALILAGAALSFDTQGAAVTALSSVLIGAGLACSNAPSTQLILRFAPAGTSAVCTSLDITCARLGGIVMVALLAQAPFAASVSAVAILSALALFCASAACKALAPAA